MIINFKACGSSGLESWVNWVSIFFLVKNISYVQRIHKIQVRNICSNISKSLFIVGSIFFSSIIFLHACMTVE